MRAILCIGLLFTLAAAPCPVTCNQDLDQGQDQDEASFIVGLTYALSSAEVGEGHTRRPHNLLKRHHGNMAKRWGEGKAPNSISKIDLSTGNVSVLAKFPDVVYVMETAYSPTTKTLYLLVNGNTLRSFHLTNNTFGKNDVTIDISGCDSGSGCFDELHYDAKNDRLIATGVGYPGGAANSIVSIDIHTGEVHGLLEFSVNCGVYLESSTFYTDMQQQFSWLSCLDNPREGNTLYLFDLSTGTNTTVMQTDPHTLLSPLVVSTTLQKILAVSNDNFLVSIGKNDSTVVSNSNLGGIPANDGLALDDRKGVDGPVVYTTVVNGMESRLATTSQLQSGIGKVNIDEVSWTLNYIHFVEGIKVL